LLGTAVDRAASALAQEFVVGRFEPGQYVDWSDVPFFINDNVRYVGMQPVPFVYS
jgi:hypothetical protein